MGRAKSVTGEHLWRGRFIKRRKDSPALNPGKNRKLRPSRSKQTENRSEHQATALEPPWFYALFETLPPPRRI